MATNKSTMTFADVFDLQMGKTPSRDNPSYWSGDNVWVSIADMKDRKYIDSSKETISDEAVKATGIREVPEGTVFMSFKLSIGKVAIAARNLYTNEAIMQFPIKPGYELSPEYLYFYLMGHKWQGANKAVMGVTLNKKRIAEECISFPSIKDQQHIVDELNLLTGIIDKKNAQLRDLDALSQSIFYEMFGDPIINEKGWTSKALGEACSLKAGKGIKASELSEELTTGLYPCFGGNGIRGYIAKKSHKGTYPIIGRQGALCGNVQLASGEFYATEHAVVCTPGKGLQAIYTYYALLAMNLNQYATGVAQPGLAVKSLLPLPIVIPPMELQEVFAERVRGINMQKALLNGSLNQINTLYQSRMAYYFD